MHRHEHWLYMALFRPEERVQAAALARLAYTNPFLPDRIADERAVLGDAFVDAEPVWTLRAGRQVHNANVERLAAIAARLVTATRARLVDGVRPSAEDLRLFEDVALYVLYDRYEDGLWHLIVDGGGQKRVAIWDGFRRDAEHLFAIPDVELAARRDLPRVFAGFFQVRRAFHHIFWNIIGGSMPAARLRAAVWESIFTHDVRRYRRALVDRMGDMTTLIVGASGTGKELVARAIALSRHVPFDPQSARFATSDEDVFHPLNLSALSPTLIESELFGHRRGSFTGAGADRVGWLEQCSALGTVFLDEIGDVDPSIQVKLLRVLQTRSFERLGETKSRRFRGKIVAATNRDLPSEMAAGRFRQDFYYRLCADVIETPTLAAQLRDAREELAHLVLFLAERVVGEEEADALTNEVVAWIERHLGPSYSWPGNVRELEQCVRNVLIHREYRPALRVSTDSRDELLAAIGRGTLTADQLLTRYCTLVYADTGSYQETARRLGLDRRTVRAKVDPEQAGSLRRAR